jgi:CxxC-x17-CxxC domain-containing protein
MGNFDRGGSKGGFRGGDRGGKPSFQKKSWGNDRGGDMHMHKATCSECGRACEVPFRPTGEKPVFCRDCFASKREGGDRGDRGARPDFNNRGPKRDLGEKPNLSFAGTDFKSVPANDETKKQLADIGYKLERLLASMDRLMDITRKEASVVKAVPAPVVAQKVEVAKAPVKAVAKAATKTVAKVAPKKVVEKKVVAKKKK